LDIAVTINDGSFIYPKVLWAFNCKIGIAIWTDYNRIYIAVNFTKNIF